MRWREPAGCPGARHLQGAGHLGLRGLHALDRLWLHAAQPVILSGSVGCSQEETLRLRSGQALRAKDPTLKATSESAVLADARGSTDGFFAAASQRLRMTGL